MSTFEEVFERAVEEGAKARYAAAMRKHGYNPRSWWRLNDSIRDSCRDAARTVLSGALPIITQHISDELGEMGRNLSVIQRGTEQITEQRDLLLAGVVGALHEAELVDSSVIPVQSILNAIAASGTTPKKEQQ